MVSAGGFEPAQRQRWSLVAPYAEAVRPAPAQWELRAWGLIAVGALAVAGVFALLLALSRLPGAETWFPWPVQFFHKGLVIHVVFSFVVWFLAVMAALACATAYRAGGPEPRARGLGPVAVWLSVAAFVLLALPAMRDGGEASLNNYVPVIIDPLFYAGLGLLALAMLLVAFRLLVNLAAPRGIVEPVVLATAVATLLFVAALVSIVFDALALGGPVDAAFNEAVFWSGGHLLQFLNVTLMLVAWYLLGGARLAAPLVTPTLLTLAAVFLLIAGLVGVGGAGMVHEPLSVPHRQWITDLQYLLAPPTLLIAVLGAKALMGAGSDGDRLAGLALWTSFAVFALGGVLGLFVDGADTRTPAHYHGVIGGVNIAFMGLFVVFLLPLLGRPLTRGRWLVAMFWMYAIGQALHSAGLFLAGGYGATRKTAGAEGLEALGAQIGLYGMGVGAVVAVIGGIIFIVVTSRALLRPAPDA